MRHLHIHSQPASHRHRYRRGNRHIHRKRSALPSTHAASHAATLSFALGRWGLRTCYSVDIDATHPMVARRHADWGRRLNVRAHHRAVLQMAAGDGEMGRWGDGGEGRKAQRRVIGAVNDTEENSTVHNSAPQKPGLLPLLTRPCCMCRGALHRLDPTSTRGCPGTAQHRCVCVCVCVCVRACVRACVRVCVCGCVAAEVAAT